MVRKRGTVGCTNDSDEDVAFLTDASLSKTSKPIKKDLLGTSEKQLLYRLLSTLFIFGTVFAYAFKETLIKVGVGGVGEGLHRRPAATRTSSTTPTGTLPLEDDEDNRTSADTDLINNDEEGMAYSSTRNKSRPALATAISRASAAAAAAQAAAAQQHQSATSSNTSSSWMNLCHSFVFGNPFMNNRELRRYRSRIITFLTVAVVYTTYIYNSGGASSFYNRGGMKSIQAGRRLQIATWNIAAINNNPFEYWITYKENPAYEELMVNIEKFIEEPGDMDVLIPNVFTEKMFTELDNRLVNTAGWKSVRSYWENDYSKRKIIANFMKDPLLGSKRLASMPDRYTNTINTEDGKTVFRPTVINMYEEDLSTQEIWWKKYEKFLFDTKLMIKDPKTDQISTVPVYSMLKPIQKAKYPDITEEESADSLPLQTMCGAIFDAILVHMMNTVSKPNIWQPLKRVMVDNLNRKKVPHTLEILEHMYIDSDIITLQEVSVQLIELARQGPLGKKFHIIAGADMDPVRDQNSVICLRKSTFPNEYTEITKDVLAVFPEKASGLVAGGDILAISTTALSGDKLVIASFHGDTNGLATIPVTDALVKTMESNVLLQDHKLIFGLDANTYENSVPGKTQDVLEYANSFSNHGLMSCWGETINPSNYTTYNARTFLQPQLNKACRQNEKRSKGDVNPKDFILFPKNDYTIIHTWKDNTGEKKYTEDMAFPTLKFPSDHGILATIIELKS